MEQVSTRHFSLVNRDLPGGTDHALCSSSRRIVLIFLLFGWYSSCSCILSSLPNKNLLVSTIKDAGAESYLDWEILFSSTVGSL